MRFRFFILTICLILATSPILLSGCSHKHSYGSEYKFNNQYHWKVCQTSDNCDITSEYEKHSFGEWQERETEGLVTSKTEYRVCFCGYEETRTS